MPYLNVKIQKIDNFCDNTFDIFCKVSFQGFSQFKKLKYDSEKNEYKLWENQKFQFELKKYLQLKFCDDLLVFEFYQKKTAKLNRNKALAKYEMLLQSIDEQAKQIFIDDNLIHPRNNSILKEKIYLEISIDDHHLLNLAQKSFNISGEEIFDLKEESSDEEDEEGINKYSVDKELLKFGIKKTIPSVDQVFQALTNNAADLIRGNISEFDNTILFHSDNIINLIGHEQFTSKLLSNWQIRVRILKLKYLLGIKENTSVFLKVQIGEQEFTTRVKQINDLTFNEVFTYRFNNMKSLDVLNKLIKISIFYRKNYMIGFNYNHFGSFTIDIGTIYKEKDHEFYLKWAPIIANQEFSKEGYVSYKGYVKCEISVQSAGDNMQVHHDKLVKHDDEDKYDIESNLILPDAYSAEHQSFFYIEFIVNIYSAQIIEITKSYATKLKNVIFDVSSSSEDENKDDDDINKKIVEITEETNVNKPDTYVRLTYGNLEKTTNLKRNTAKPVWNKKFMFKILYPPLIRCLKIELCCKNTFQDDVIATEYIYLDDISHPMTTNCSLPCFGPASIDLFDEPYILTLQKKSRLAEYQDDDQTINSTDDESRMNISDNESFIKNDEVNSVITQSAQSVQSQPTTTKKLHKYSSDNNNNNSKISSLVSFNGYGNRYIGRLLIKIESAKYYRKSNANLPETSIPPAELGKVKLYSKSCFTLFSCLTEVSMIDSRFVNSEISFRLTIGIEGYSNQVTLNNVTTKTKPIQLSKEMPIFIPIEKNKPCLSIEFNIDDTSHILYKMNYILKKNKDLKTKFNKMLEANTNYELIRLTEAFNESLDEITKYLKQYKKVVFTQFDENRIKSVQDAISRIKGSKDKIEVIKGKVMWNQFVIKMKYDCEIISQFANEPASVFPDVNLWMLSGDVPVGLCTFKANDVIWSTETNERGYLCGKMVYSDVKSLNPNDASDLLAQNISRIKVMFWLGLKGESTNIFQFLPQGHEIIDVAVTTSLPREIYIKETFKFKLCAYIYQGSNMIGLDSSGLSDPFVKIKFYNQSVTGEFETQTNNPSWNITLYLKEVFLYGSLESIVESPPEIIIEVFDRDKFVKDEFMGRSYVRPAINKTKAPPPKLKWHKIYYLNKPAGEILASFELILQQNNDETELDKEANTKLSLFSLFNKHLSQINSTNIPKQILPKSIEYTLEILFWGLRGLRSTSFFQPISQTKVEIEIEIGKEKTLSSEVGFGSSNVNFNPSYIRKIIFLPEDDQYKPSLHIRCTKFLSIKSRKELIGSYTLDSINNYYKTETSLKETYSNMENYLNSMSQYYSKSKFDRSESNDALNSKPDEIKVIEKQTSRLKCDLNWWSKYYASVNDYDFDEEKPEDKTKSDVDSFFGQESVAESKHPEEIQIENEKGDKKRGRRRSKIKRSIKKLVQNAKLPKPKPKNIFMRQEVERFRIYDCELEEVEEFKKCFDETLETFPLIKGKYDEQQEDNVQCYFKGKFLLYKENDTLNQTFGCILKKHCGFLALSPPNTPIQLRARIYIIKASMNVVGTNLKPYLWLNIGDRVYETVNSVNFNESDKSFLFAKMVECDIKFPYDTKLSISLHDSSILGGQERIGKTEIDLENRFYAKCYASCGIPLKYETSGYNAWRDAVTPCELLRKMCKQFGLERPVYERGQLILAVPNEDPSKKKKQFKYPKSYAVESFNKSSQLETDNISFEPLSTNSKQQLALDALNDWQAITGQSLVPEHVETRSLYNEEVKNFVQAQLEMWIDLFPYEDYKIPKEVDIELPKPIKLQLRVIIKNTKDVYLDDINPITKERTSDIYVKGWIADQLDKVEKTDTHYRSRTGEGNFNYRFIFEFDYLLGENKIIIQDNKFLIKSFGKVQRKVDPILHLEVWDADFLTRDDFIGKLELNLSNFMRGSKTSKGCEIKRMFSSEWEKFNLFHVQQLNGWWPFVNLEKEQLMGKLEAEFLLLTEEEALKDPAGRGHDEPQALEIPKRPDDSYLWFMSPLRTLRYDIWQNHKCLIIKIIIALFFVILILVFIYQFPSVVLQRLLKLN